LKVNILQKIEAAKNIAALSSKPTEVKDKIQKIESEISTKLDQIASGEVKGKKLGGVVQSLKSLEKKQLGLQDELNQLNAKMRESQAVLNPAPVTHPENGTNRYMSLEKRVAMLPDDKMLTVKDMMEMFGLSSPGCFRFLRHALKAGLIEVKIQGKRGKCHPTYYAKTGVQPPSEKMIAEKNARLESERKIAGAEEVKFDQSSGKIIVDSDLGQSRSHGGHPLLANLTPGPHTFDQIKAHLREAMNTGSQAVLAKKITELQIGGYLRRFVEREKVFFIKN